MSRPDFELKEGLIARPEPRKNLATAADINDLLIGVQFLYDSLGWERYFDRQYTEANKRELTAGQPSILTIDGATSILTQAPVVEGHIPFWQANKLRSPRVGNFYTARLDFTASIASNDGYAESYIDFGGTRDIASDTLIFPKGANVAHPFGVYFDYYTLETFVANGGQIVIRPSHTLQIWDISILIQQTFNGR